MIENNQFMFLSCVDSWKLKLEKKIRQKTSQSLPVFAIFVRVLTQPHNSHTSPANSKPI